MKKLSNPFQRVIPGEFYGVHWEVALRGIVQDAGLQEPMGRIRIKGCQD
jgi:hypothetical protein